MASASAWLRSTTAERRSFPAFLLGARVAKIDILIAPLCPSHKLSNLHAALDAKPFVAGRYHFRLLDIILRNLAAGRGI
jgi:hypothetical protein